jgi:DNA-binding NarL/FixJ family response regulator
VLAIENSGFEALLIKMNTHHELPDSRERVTPAEAEVARAAVSGLSNREIANRRFSSPRTVAAQLRSVYRKLGVHSRTELAAVID